MKRNKTYVFLRLGLVHLISLSPVVSIAIQVMRLLYGGNHLFCISFISSSNGGHLGWLQNLAAVNGAAVSIDGLT